MSAPMSKLDTLGEKIKRRISTLEGLKDGVESERHDIGSDLRVIWGAFAEAKKNKTTITINGKTSKTEYAAFLGVDMRYCQYLVRDGNRKRTRKDDGEPRVRVVTLKIGETYALDRVGEGRVKYTLEDNLVGGLFLKRVKEEQTAKSQEEKKPIKHAKNPKTYAAWCRVSLNQNNTAHQTRHSNCPYCIAAKEAGLPVTNPEPERRRLERELAQWQESLAHAETYNKDESHLAELREDVAKLERKLAAVKEVKTPEQAVEVAKRAAGEREVQRKADAATPMTILNEAVERNAAERESKLDAKRDGAMHPAAGQLEETLKSTDAECIAVPDEEQNCDYSEDEVAAMFAKGGK